VFFPSVTRYGGQPAIDFFNGGYVSGAVSMATPMTIFIVGNAADAANSTYYYCASQGIVGIYEDTHSPAFNYATVFNGAQILPSHSSGIIYVTASSASWAIAAGQFTPQATGNLGTESAGGLVIGTDSSLNNSLSGYIAEVAVYNSVLSAAQIRMMTRYLANRYGLTEGP
jgi:ABC-type antimicrobial peptide transport system permease subunit